MRLGIRLLPLVVVVTALAGCASDGSTEPEATTTTVTDTVTETVTVSSPTAPTAAAPPPDGFLVVDYRTSVGPHTMVRPGGQPTPDSGDPSIRQFSIPGNGAAAGQLRIEWNDAQDGWQSLRLEVTAGCAAGNCTGRFDATGASPLVADIHFDQAEWINVTLREASQETPAGWFGASLLSDIHVAGVLHRPSESLQPQAFVVEGGHEAPSDLNCEHGGRPVPTVADTWNFTEPIRALHLAAQSAPGAGLPCFQLWGPTGELVWATQASAQVVLRDLPAGAYRAVHFALGPATQGTMTAMAYMQA